MSVTDDLNTLRLLAFKTNSEADRTAYFDALSLAFQRGELVEAALAHAAVPDGQDTTGGDPLPCPFCGGQPKTQLYEDAFEPPHQSWRVQCRCGAAVGAPVDEKDFAVERWNSRSMPGTSYANNSLGGFTAAPPAQADLAEEPQKKMPRLGTR